MERNPIMKSSVYAGVMVLLLLSPIFHPVISSSPASEKIKVNVKFINMNSSEEITAVITKEEAKKLIAIVNHSMEKISNGYQMYLKF